MKKRAHKYISNKISKKIFIPYFILIALTIALMSLHIQTRKKQDSDSVKINLAGRQRMLTQKLSKEILQFEKNITQKKQLLQTMKIFSATLDALTYGGTAPLDLFFKKSITLPTMKDLNTKHQLLMIDKLWQQFKKKVLLFINKKDRSAFNYIIKINTKILTEMDKAVFMMQKSAEIRNKRINTIFYITYFVIILMLTILLSRKFYQLSHASAYIKNLETILPICAKCKKIREPNSEQNSQEAWTEIESYIENRSDSKFTHGLCPSCEEELYGGQAWHAKQRKKK